MIHLLDGINQTKDKQSPESTVTLQPDHTKISQNIHTVASQAVHYVRKKSNMKSWNEKHPGHLVLPKKFFELLKESEAREVLEFSVNFLTIYSVTKEDECNSLCVP